MLKRSGPGAASTATGAKSVSTHGTYQQRDGARNLLRARWPRRHQEFFRLGELVPQVFAELAQWLEGRRS